MYRFFFIIVIVCLTACGPASERETKSADSAAAVTAAVAEARSTTSMYNDFNTLESIFDNQNYLVVNGKDSSYFYFSRLNHTLIRTYTYKISKGDSAQVRVNTIQPDEKNNIIWEWNGKKLKLAGADRGQVRWVSSASDSTAVSFLKLDKNTIRLSYPGRKELVLQKISPLSLFLVRSRYDYQHGTHYAFETGKLKINN